MKNQNLKQRVLTSVFLLSLIFLFLNSNLILVYSIIVFGVIAILEFVNITFKITKNKIFLFLSNLSFIIYIFIFSFLFIVFSNSSHLKLLTFIILLVCIASDIGGYILGKTFKGPKLTKISPNKTVTGALGSLLFSVIVMIFFNYFYLDKIHYQIIFVAVATSIFSQIGDLFFSYLKRKAKLEDTGSILPGHGGVLDRIDSILLGLPAGFYFIIILFF